MTRVRARCSCELADRPWHRSSNGSSGDEAACRLHCRHSTRAARASVAGDSSALLSSAVRSLRVCCQSEKNTERARFLLTSAKLPFTEVDVSLDENSDAKEYMKANSQAATKTVLPQIFLNGAYKGTTADIDEVSRERRRRNGTRRLHAIIGQRACGRMASHSSSAALLGACWSTVERVRRAEGQPRFAIMSAHRLGDTRARTTSTTLATRYWPG